GVVDGSQSVRGDNLRGTHHLFVFLIILGQVGCHNDPPDDGTLTLFLEKESDRPALQSVGFTVRRVDVVYADGSAASQRPHTDQHIDCDAPNFTTAFSGTEVHTVSTAGAVGSRRLLQSIFAPGGNISEIRFVLEEKSVTAEFTTRTHRVKSTQTCHDVF